METILSYKERGNWGDANYRGNCSGYIIKDLLEFFKPSKFVEVFSGSGTGEDVSKELGYKNSVHLDLNSGWNALVDDIPTGSDFVFSHPPYWDIIEYSKVNKRVNPYDLSNKMPYEEFIKRLDKVNSKIYQSLVNGGRHAFLVGDIRKKGKYYSVIKDMAWIGDLEVHMVKQQHNTMSGRKRYAGNFVAINHEHLLIFKKNEIWNVPVKLTSTQTFNLKAFENMTWRDLIQGALEYLGGESNLSEIYSIIEDSKKARKNKHWKEKVRQTLQIHNNFNSNQRGVWRLEIA
ncbi:hypothetical protein [Priestia sp. FSL R5-0680]|uniref:hypothetical protein n=1 Tax=Priestia sp. FSL R5-0680 TaxID=2921582 RepID=UPI0030FA41A5